MSDDAKPMAAATLAMPAAVKTLGQVLEARKEEFQKRLPKAMSADKLIKIVVTCASRTPELQKCTIESVLKSAYAAAELGLEPGGVLGHAYLVPFGGQCQLIIGYRGLIRLCHNSGDVLSIRAVVVREKDKFRLVEGMTQRIVHEPFLDGDPGPMTRVYAVASLRGGERQAEVMSRAQVDAIRGRSKAGASGPWKSDYEEMAKKTVVRRLCKYLPMSDEARRGIDKDEDVIDGEVTESVDAPAPADRAQAKVHEALGLPAESLESQLAASVEMAKTRPENMKVAMSRYSDAEKAEILKREAEVSK